MKYRGIEQLKQTGHAVAPCCKLLKVSSSGFYDWLKREPSKNTRRDDELTGKILRVYTENKGCYGSPRIHRLLHLHGEAIGRNRVARLMRESGLNAGRTKAYRPRTTMSNPSQKKSPRVFRIESSTVTKANEVWASDLTYLPAGAGFAYLVVVLDIYTREITGWNVSDSMESTQTEKALLQAVRRTPGELNSLVFHSDQGTQYCAQSIRDKLEMLHITQSMSRRGNCYDNAFVESFFHTLKNELGKPRFQNLQEARKIVFEYINWYNRERLHSSLDYMSPMNYALKTAGESCCVA